MKRQWMVRMCLAVLLVSPAALYSKDKKPKAGAAEPAAVASSAPVANLSDAQQEEFLRTAKIIKMRSAGKGVTGSQRITLSDGTITHDAHVEFIDESKSEFKTDRGVELNFRDSYKYNIAAYRLSRMLGIQNVPVCVERKVGGKTSAVDWWADNVLMDEGARHAKKMDAPDPEKWNEEMYVVRVFDQLIYNVDRNLGNLLITRNWDLVMIDHSRSFRLMHTLQNAKNLVKCDRSLLSHLRALDKDAVMQQLRPWCTKAEIDAVMARRDAIVKFFDEQVKEKGESAVLYDLKPAAVAATP